MHFKNLSDLLQPNYSLSNLQIEQLSFIGWTCIIFLVAVDLGQITTIECPEKHNEDKVM